MRLRFAVSGRAAQVAKEPAATQAAANNDETTIQAATGS